MRTLAILGASGHGKVVADTAMQSGYDKVVFFDDAWPGLQVNGYWKVVGDTSTLLQYAEKISGVIVAIGQNHVRLGKTLQMRGEGLPLVSLVHPNAYVAEDVVIEPGSVVFAGAVVQPGSSIGFAGIVNSGATVDHDCMLGAGVHVCPGAHLAGGVKVGECTWIGIGSSVNQNLTIGVNVVIGAGAAVIADIPDEVTAVGVPARVVTKD